MRGFFIPGAHSDAQRDRIYEGIVCNIYVRNPERYYSLSYISYGQLYFAKVGQPHPMNGETVVAILKERYSHAPYLICTTHRGVLGGSPIYADSGWQSNATRFAEA